MLKNIYRIVVGRSIRSVYIYRISNLLYMKKFRFLGQIFWNLNLILHSIEISPTAKIGKNFVLPHTPGIVIGGGAIIGDGVKIYQNVTIGADSNKNYPVIGNDVTIYPGAVLIGNIKIGNNAIIGANSFVNKNVIENEIVAGVPAKKIGENS